MTESEFDEWGATGWTSLCRQIELICGDARSAEASVREAFVQAWRRRDRFSDGDDVLAWVRKRAEELSGLQARIRRDAGELTGLHAAMQLLPLKQRRALVLKYVAGLSEEKIATEMSASVATVRVWLLRGQAACAQYLTVEEEGLCSVPTC